jgi:hypothetical protein
LLPCSLDASGLALDGEPDFDGALAGGGVEAFVVALEVRCWRGFEARGGEPLLPYELPCVVEGGDAVGFGEDGVVGGGDDHAAFGWRDGEVGNFEGAHVLEALVGQVGLTGGAVEDLCSVEAGDGGLVEVGPLLGDVSWSVGEGVEATQAGEAKEGWSRKVGVSIDRIEIDLEDRAPRRLAYAQPFEGQSAKKGEA